MFKRTRLRKIRNDFPILDEKIYLDNAATSLTPEPILDAFIEYNKKYRANIERGVHHLSKMATHRYKEAHKKVADLIGASEEEIVFLKNTTEAINTVSRGLDFEEEDQIIISKMEHHSNLLPWMRLRKDKDIKLDFVGINEDGSVNLRELRNKIDSETKLVSISHASNVLGTLNPVEKIGKICDETETLFLVDAAQTIPHSSIDVEDMKCDFLCFSGHKALATTGTGALFVKKEIQNKLKPMILGGGMVKEVSYNNYELKQSNEGYEAGTPNIGGGIAFGEACDYIKEIGIEKIEEHTKELSNYLVKKLKNVNNLEIIFPDSDRIGVVSFNIEKISSHKVASLLDEKNIIVRSGEHCSQPLLNEIGFKGLVRVSMLFYNSKNDIDELIKVIS